MGLADGDCTKEADRDLLEAGIDWDFLGWLRRRT